MNRRFVKHLSLTLALAAGFSVVTCVSDAQAAKKQVTITERIQELTSKVNAGQKSNELTLKEADGLRDKLEKASAKIEKCKAKNGGKLSYKDENSIEKDLNKVSVKVHSAELNKRTK